MYAGWTSPFIPKLLRGEDYPFKITNEVASYIAVFGPVGEVFGELLAMLLVDKLGRRMTLLALGTTMLFSSIFIYFSFMSPILLFLARFCGGISLGSVLCVNPIYISEISRPQIRGKLGVMMAFLYSAGTASINMIGNYYMAFSLMPESPYFLLMKKDVQAAAKSLNFFRMSQNVDKELTTLNLAVLRQLGESKRYKDIFVVKSNRKALLLMSFGRMTQILTGSTAFIMYAQNLLADSKNFVEPQFAVIVIYFVQACLTPFTGYFCDKWGRVPLLVSSSAVCSLCLISLGGYFVLKDFEDLRLPISCPVFILGFFYMSYQLGLGSVIDVLAGELFSTSIKSRAICFASMFFSVAIIISTKFYQISTDYWHPSVAPFVFAIFAILGAICIRKYFPETKGKSLEEIQQELKGK
ncbi:hypothetical protein WA026_011196 [Henosepilachna vigintioctopunctata]|uniref:Major facilitator superfamily (MFS) profile domain-containing protein n=1 Tax=Henosepilachna vigintioctopunctata TaxID=420089 RepID=A0AAW1U9V4_9CUCU